MLTNAGRSAGDASVLLAAVLAGAAAVGRRSGGVALVEVAHARARRLGALEAAAATAHRFRPELPRRPVLSHLAQHDELLLRERRRRQVRPLALAVLPLLLVEVLVAALLELEDALLRRLRRRRRRPRRHIAHAPKHAVGDERLALRTCETHRFLPLGAIRPGRPLDLVGPPGSARRREEDLFALLLLEKVLELHPAVELLELLLGLLDVFGFLVGARRLDGSIGGVLVLGEILPPVF